MSSEDLPRFSLIREYFSDEEWNTMSFYVKSRMTNLKENYDLLLGMGCTPPVPDFIKPKPSSRPGSAGTKQASTTAAAAPSGKENRPPKSAVAGAATPLQRGSSRLASRPCVKPLFAAQEKQEEEYDPGEGTSSQTRYPKRSRKSVNYAECEVPSEDEFFYCLECGEDRHGDCPVHGPLEFVKDTPVPPGDPQRANKTLPEGLTLARSCIKGAGKGVFTLRPLPARLCYGPYEGVRFTGSGGGNGYTWKVRGRGGYLVDARPLSESNWMRYVNCAPSEKSQNLVAFQHRGGVYYQTKAKIAPGTELLVWYGDEFGAELGLVEGKDGAQNKHQEEGPSLEGPVQTFACGDCDSVFASLEHLQGHRKRMHERRGGRHRCGHCPYSSDEKQHLLEHERTHTGERPFVCGTCGMAFTQQGHLTTHQKVHTGERPHECAECGQKFARLADLRTHERTHSGERPHVCPECGRGFVHRGDLAKHRRTHSGEKPYACHLCSYRTPNISHLKRHVIQAHSKEYSHKCGDCGRGFLAPGELRSHMRRQHSSDDQER
ncbi:histone-lysine N-methyltransferase PRDM9-like isoform X1 [Ixodes scapularis]|uniref:histone-lysine N-methyltransferase PRDM9-like isoform X1 n=1 Tax=Ixodes scapularis TaxID=6945 RepID=UPI001C392B78|nr:histone-lysine N-methyltransferase PRDM9-like isoform X1 [Ixodes scapularis]